MPVDLDLTERVRSAVATQAAAHEMHTDERRMFGGLTFMIEGKMACGVVNHDMMARVGPDHYARALDHPHTRPMDFTGQPLKGYVFIDPEGSATPTDVDKWVSLAIDCVKQLTRARHT